MSTRQPQAPTRAAPLGYAEDGRRDRKKLVTRRALRAAALELVAERGFAHVTVEDIAQVADVATRTFFNYFPSKEAAVIGVDPDLVKQMAADVLARPASESPLQALRVVLVAYAAVTAEELDDLGDGRSSWFRRLCVVRADPELLSAYAAHVAALERGLAAALAERLGTDSERDPYPALVAATALAAVRVAGLYWAADGGTDSLIERTESAIASLCAGLAREVPVVRRKESVSAR